MKVNVISYNLSRTNSLKQVIDMMIWIVLWLELDEGALLDLIGDILSHELGHQGEGKLEAGSGSSTGHDVSIDDNPVLEDRQTPTTLMSHFEVRNYFPSSVEISSRMKGRV